MALGVALLAVLWQFLGINNFRVVNTKDPSPPPPQLSSLLSIVYGHILISAEANSPPERLSGFFFSLITNQSNDRLFLAEREMIFALPFASRSYISSCLPTIHPLTWLRSHGRPLSRPQ
jgi:hypothetical protein